MNATHLAVPAHVSAQHLVDFDFANPHGAEIDVYEAWAKLQVGTALAWTPHDRGHWIATRAGGIESILSDREHFSPEEFTLPRRGNKRPRVPPPPEYDPPLHADFRRILNPALSPVVVHGLENNIRELCIELIEPFRSRGHCEFVVEFAHHLPTRIFLRHANLPEAQRVQFMEWGEVMFRSTDEHVRTETARKDHSVCLRRPCRASPSTRY